MSRINVVLRVRRAQESIAKGQLLAANTVLREAETKEHAWERSLSAWGSNLPSAAAGEFRAWRSSLQEGNRELSRLAQTTAQAAAERTNAMNALVEASRRVEILERLEERLEEAATAEEIAREQTVIDEIATSTYARNRP